MVSFVKAHEAKVIPLYKNLTQAYWNLTTTGKKEYQEELDRWRYAHDRIYANPAEYEQLKKWKELNDFSDPLLKRQVEVLYRAYLFHQEDPTILKERVRLEGDLTSLFTNFRATLRGRKVTENEINQILHEESDSGLRKEAWESAKGIGAEAAPKILRLAELRNQRAQALGFRNYFHLSLAAQELEESELLSLFSQIIELSENSYHEVKEQLDEELSHRFHTPVKDLRPWHYADPFFQDAPPRKDFNLDPFFEHSDLEAITSATYDAMGWEIQDILKRSDLYERPGKNQHGFCLNMDREGDIRVLCNVRKNARWMGTLLHEYGHAVYDKYISRELPFTLRIPSHIFTTEAVALFMDRLIYHPEWLTRWVGVEPAKASRLSQSLQDYQRLKMLIFTRWVVVVVNFEKSLYENPQADLNTLWWNLVEKYQKVPRPDGRNAPDWATKIHIATHPVYYQNYLLGQWMASQMEERVQQQAPRISPETGAYLRENLFSLGARYNWKDTVKIATGSPLSPAAFARQFYFH